MGWARDQFDRPTLVRNEYRAVSVGGRPQERESLLIDGRPFRPIVHMTLGRGIGSRSLFAHEQRAGVSQLPDDECWAALRSTDEIDGNERMREDHGVLWTPGRGGWEHRFYETAAGLEYEIVLPREPAGCVVPFVVQTGPGVAWYHQPELTPDEIDEGAIRPENVIDSWAIYAGRAGNWRRPDGSEIVRYETGKLGHVYRPFVLDAHGERHWCSWIVEHGVPVGIRVPAGLQYPAILGPTVGWTACGGTQAGVSAYTYACGPFTAAAAGTADSASLFVNITEANCQITLGYYGEAEGVPSALLGDTAGDTLAIYDYNAENGPFTSNLDSGARTIATATNYHTAFAKFSQAFSPYYDAAGATRWYGGTNGTLGNLPDPFDGAASTTRRYSQYINYTASGGGPVIPVFMQSHRRRWA